MSQEINQQQYDVLWGSLKDNPLLPASSLALKNKALKTKKQNVIGGVNEILVEIEKLNKAVKNFDEKYNNILGDPESHPDLINNLKKIDENVLLSVIKLWKVVQGDNKEVQPLEKSVTETVSDLVETIKQVTSEEEVVMKDVQLSDIKNTFKLISEPNEKKVRLFINGIPYLEDDSFIVDRKTKTLTWTFDSNKNGFELDKTLHYEIKYYKLKEQ